MRGACSRAGPILGVSCRSAAMTGDKSTSWTPRLRHPQDRPHRRAGRGPARRRDAREAIMRRMLLDIHTRPSPAVPSTISAMGRHRLRASGGVERLFAGRAHRLALDVRQPPLDPVAAPAVPLREGRDRGAEPVVDGPVPPQAASPGRRRRAGRAPPAFGRARRTRGAAMPRSCVQPAAGRLGIAVGPRLGPRRRPRVARLHRPHPGTRAARHRRLPAVGPTGPSPAPRARRRRARAGRGPRAGAG